MNTARRSLHRATPWLVAAFLASAACASKSGKGTTPPDQASSIRTNECAFPHPDPNRRVVQWALGCDHVRQSRPPSSTASLIWLGLDDHGATTRPHRRVCTEGSSILPAPSGSYVYLVKSGKLYAVDPALGTVAPVQTHGHDGWLFSRLLGIARYTSEFVMLAEVVAEGGEDTALWLFAVQGTRATGRLLPEASRPDSPERLAEGFVLPRCADGFSSCLIVTQAGSLRQADRGNSTRPVALDGVGKQDDVAVIDGVWSRARPREIILLASAGGCTTGQGAQP